MIYIQESSFCRQMDLLSIVAQSQNEISLIAWLYPETDMIPIAGLTAAVAGDYIAVTSYGSEDNNEYGAHTTPKKFTTDLTKELISNQAEALRLFDSLALYKNGEADWIASVIHHENICLVQNDDLIDALLKNNFRASVEPPAWW